MLRVPTKNRIHFDNSQYPEIIEFIGFFKIKPKISEFFLAL